MRFNLLASLLLALLLLAGCSSDEERLRGTWYCTTTHPGGASSRDTFTFLPKGAMSLESEGLSMPGSYALNGAELIIDLVGVPGTDPMGRMMTQPQKLTATIKKLTDRELEMDVSTGQNHHLSSCRRG